MKGQYHNADFRTLVILSTITCLACGYESTLPNATQHPEAGTTLDSAAPDSAADAILEASAEASPDAPMVIKRTVHTRDPFGNTAAHDNLLLDGDFEWATSMASQYPWIRTNAGSFAIPALRHGFECRSGMQCAFLSSGQGMAGIAMRPPQNAPSMRVRAWIRPMTPLTCKDLTVSVGQCFRSSGGSFLWSVSRGEPDERGWCAIETTQPTPGDTPCVFMSVPGDGSSGIMVDDVVVQPSDDGSTRSAHHVPAAHAQWVTRLQSAAQQLASPKPPQAPQVPALVGRGRR